MKKKKNERVLCFHSISIGKSLLLDLMRIIENRLYFRKNPKFKMFHFFVALTGIYSQNFTYNTTPVSQCTAWNTFRNLLTSTSYTLLTISGSNSPTGISLTNPTYVVAIANALRNGTAYGPVSSNGYSWVVVACSVSGGNLELTATGSGCACNTGYTVRPCIGNVNWGGINTTTCSPVSQMMKVTFQ